MPKVLAEWKNEKTTRITKLSLSDDWRTLTPWTHKGDPVSYVFSYIRETSKSGDVDFTYIYVGPFGIISGKWIPEN